MIKVEDLQKGEEDDYTNLIGNSKVGMRAHTLRWINVLRKFTNTEPFFIVAKRKGQIIGGLPSLLKRNSKYGNVMNSLPFCGTHGGPFISNLLNKQERIETKKKLILRFKEISKDNDCVYSTLITTPFEIDVDIINEAIDPTYIDSRITQMIIFPKKFNEIEKEILYNKVEKRCRNAINKAKRSGMKIEFAQNLDHVDLLFEMHKNGMKKKTVGYKPLRFFEILFDEFKIQNREFNLLYAWMDNKIIAALLVLFYGNISTYFTPTFNLEYSEYQPNTFLIYEAMKKAVKNGRNIWNFGGTRPSLKGVYRFKKSWGAKDFPYYYFINCYNENNCIISLSEKKILEEYKWFYVLPFKELNLTK